MWTNVDFSSVRSSDIHLMVISQGIPKPSLTKISFKIIHLNFIQISQEQMSLFMHDYISFLLLHDEKTKHLKQIKHSPTMAQSTLLKFQGPLQLIWFNFNPSIDK